MLGRDMKRMRLFSGPLSMFGAKAQIAALSDVLRQLRPAA